MNPFDLSQFQRDFFISRIIAGYLLHPKRLKIYHPTKDIEYESNLIYMEMYEIAREKNIYNEDEIIEFMKDNGEWSDLLSKELEVAPNNIEYLQCELYSSSINQKPIKNKYREDLNKYKEKIGRLYAIKHKYDMFTCHGVATQTKTQFCIEHNTLYNNLPYNFNEVSLLEVVSYFNENILNPETIRYLARTTPWVNIWNTAKINGTIFSSSGVELTKEQQLLLFWSKIYDNIHEHPEAPPEYMFLDDDLIDGWMAFQRKNAGKDKQKIEGKGAEMFIITDKDNAKNIFDMNSSIEKSIIKSRLNKVVKEGQVDYYKFGDVQQRKMNELNARRN